MHIQEDRSWNGEIKEKCPPYTLREPKCISHFFIAIMPKDSIRLPDYIISSREDSIGKSDMENYRSRLSRPTLGEWYMVGYSRFILHIPRIYIFGFETPPRSMGLLFMLRQLCQKRSKVWITELELSDLCAQLCRVHRPLDPTTLGKLLCFYCWPDAYACSFIYFAVYLFYSIKQQRAGGVLLASENFDRLDMHRCWSCIEFDQFCTLLLPPLSLFSPRSSPFLAPSRVYIRDIRYR